MGRIGDKPINVQWELMVVSGSKHTFCDRVSLGAGAGSQYFLEANLSLLRIPTLAVQPTPD